MITSDLPPLPKLSADTTDARQYDYANEGPRNSRLWSRRYLLFLMDVTAVFDGFTALNIADLGIGHNELRVVVGPNGAGKTTMCDVVSGLTKPATGKVFFDGQEITGLREADIARRGIGRKFQIPNVFDSLTVWENMLLAAPSLGPEIGSPEWFRENRQSPLLGPGAIGMRKLRASLVRMSRGPEAPIRERIEQILGRVHLIDVRETLAKNLSHGQRQWLAISTLILSSPKLLLVDEPAAGLTDAETMLTAELLLELRDEHSIIVIEHDMEFVRRLGARVTVLTEGRVMAEGTIDEVSANEDVIEAYLGR